MPLTELEIVEYIKGLSLDEDAEAYEAFNRFTLLSNEVFTELMEKLVDIGSGVVISDFYSLTVIDDESVSLKLEELATGSSELADARAIIMAEIKVSTDAIYGYDALRFSFVSGAEISGTVDPEAFEKYVVRSMQRNDRYIVERVIDETKADTTKFWSYSTLINKFSEILTNPTLGDALIQSEYSTQKATNMFLDAPYLLQEESIDYCFSLPHVMVDTLGVSSIMKDDPFVDFSLSELYTYGSPGVWDIEVRTFLEEAAQRYVDQAGAETHQESARHVLLDASDGYLFDDSVWGSIETLKYRHIQAATSITWIIPYEFDISLEEIRARDDLGEILTVESVSWNPGETVIGFEEARSGTASVRLIEMDFQKQWWRAQILRYYLPSLDYFAKSAGEQTAIDTEWTDKISLMRTDLASVRDLLVLLNERLELLLVPSNV